MAESRPRPEIIAEKLVTADEHQQVLDAGPKIFADEVARRRGYDQRIVDLNTGLVAQPPPYQGEPSVAWDGIDDWPGVQVWNGFEWKPLRKPLAGQEGLVTVSISDAETATLEREIGEDTPNLVFIITLRGRRPRNTVSVDYIAEELYPVPLRLRHLRNTQGELLYPPPEHPEAQLGIDFAGNIENTAVFNPDDPRASTGVYGDFVEQELGDLGTVYLARVEVPVLADQQTGEPAERMQVRLKDPVRCRIDREIGIGIIAPETRPTATILDTSVDLSGILDANIPGGTIQVPVHIVSNYVDLLEPVTFTVSTADGTAIGGQDYNPLSNDPHSIPLGQTGRLAGQITVPITYPSQQNLDADETFTLTITPTSDNVYWLRYTATITLKATPFTPVFNLEGETGGTLYGDAGNPDTVSLLWTVNPYARVASTVEWWITPYNRPRRLAGHPRN